MKRLKRSWKVIIGKQCEAEVLLAQGKKVGPVHGVDIRPLTQREQRPQGRPVAKSSGPGILIALKMRAMFQAIADSHPEEARRMGASDALSYLIARKPVDLVIDVGANTGQTGTALRAAGYRGPIVSFEPQSDAYTRLAERADADPAWTVRPEALGADDGAATLHVTQNVGSSSLLQPTSWAQGAFKAVVARARQQVEVARLATLFPHIRGSARWPVLKLDCQGSERAILSGGEEVLGDIPYIVIEASVVELYTGETLLPEMLRIMAGYGYRPIDLQPGFRHPETDDILQVDVAFSRETPVTRPAQ